MKIYCRCLKTVEILQKCVGGVGKTEEINRKISVIKKKKMRKVM